MKIIAFHTHYLTKEKNFEENFLKELDKTGVEKAVVLGNWWVDSVNDYVINFARRNPDRIIGFAYLDPRLKNAPQLLEKYILKNGLKGLKLISGIGFYPNDKSIYPVYEKAQELKIPVMIHVSPLGPMIPKARLKYSQPIYVDDVARDFPKLNIIIAHSGFPFIEQTMALKLPNIFVETSGLGPPLLFEERMKKLWMVFGPRRILFGGSGYNYRNMGRCINEVDKILDKLSVPEKERKMVFRENAERIFKNL